MKVNNLPTLLANEPLVHSDSTLAMIHDSFLESPRGGIYYGTGLTTPKAPSVGLPFDVLTMILVAEKFRRIFDLDVIHHHIADTHALTNDFCAPESVAKLAAEYRQVLLRIKEVAGISLEIHLSSEFDNSADYNNLLASVQTDKSEYVRREMADILWYQHKYNVHLKLGWLVQSTETEIGFDERLYDREFRKQCDQTMSFGYVVAGRTLDPKRIKASPYIAIKGESRVLFQSGENVRAKYEEAIPRFNGDKNLGGVLSHWSAILRLWDRVSKTPSPREKDIINRVQGIINLITP